MLLRKWMPRLHLPGFPLCLIGKRTIFAPLPNSHVYGMLYNPAVGYKTTFFLHISHVSKVRHFIPKLDQHSTVHAWQHPPHPLTRKIVLASGDYLQLFQSKPFPTSVVYQRLTSIYLPIYPQSKASCESSLAPNDYKDTFMYIQGYIHNFFWGGGNNTEIIYLCLLQLPPF